VQEETAARTGSRAMSLPYFELPELPARVPVHVFGAIVTTGVIAGGAVMRRYARRVGENDEDARRVAGWLAVTGIVGAHVLDVLFYRPGEALHHPLVLFEVWTSISSFGGFVGGALGFLYIVRRRRLRIAKWADIAMVGLLVAFTIGRVGCASVHDHIGAETTSAIGVDFPRDVLAQHGVLDGMRSSAPVVRAHDLGLEELMYLVPMTALVLWLAFRRRLRPGLLAALAAALYAPVRFALERWRPESTDPLYGGLTFAQWGTIAIFVLACAIGARALAHRSRGTS